MWFDLLVFELVSIGDALAQAANVIFEFNESPKKLQLTQIIHERIRSELGAKCNFAPSESEATGLDEWVEEASWLQDVRELRNQATHRHLVKLLESKPWNEKPTTPPVGATCAANATSILATAERSRLGSGSRSRSIRSRSC